MTVVRPFVHPCDGSLGAEPVVGSVWHPPLVDVVRDDVQVGHRVGSRQGWDRGHQRRVWDYPAVMESTATWSRNQSNNWAACSAAVAPWRSKPSSTASRDAPRAAK